MSTEEAKMLARELYLASDPALTAARQRARRLTRIYNNTHEDELDKRTELLRELFGYVGTGAYIEPPFQCDYGTYIHAGERLYMNFGCVILDCNRVTIGDDVLIGPGVHIYAATHPVEPEIRLGGRELGLPVKIGNTVWIGGGAIICPGVTIGDGAVIGAGSVVTRDIPPRCVAAGNPGRIIRQI
jgi:maltose O-acetyltransferase